MDSGRPKSTTTLKNRIPVTLASRNEGKRRELEALAAGAFDLRLLPQAAPETVEDGETYLDNALKKARDAATFVGGAALADDSGLEVDALGGRPGIHSARFGGSGLDDAGRVAHLLDAMGDATDRQARFRCVLVFLEEGRCSIYPVRPSQCRTFPFWPELLRSRAVWDEDVAAFCPGVGTGPLHDRAAIEKVLREAAV